MCLGHAADGGCSGEGEQELAPRPSHHHTGTATGATCPGADAPTAQSFGTAFMRTYCLGCHSASVTGAARQAAPVGVDFDTLEDVRRQASRIDLHAAAGPNATNTEMPPAGPPQPAQQEREKLGQWLACGAP